MSALSRFEGFMQELMDGRVVRLFGGAVQPVDLAKRLGRCMEEQQARSHSAPTVPNEFTISLHPEDYGSLVRLDRALESKLAEYALGFARERGFNFVAPPLVRLQADGALHLGQVEVQAAMRPKPGVQDRGSGVHSLLSAARGPRSRVENPGSTTGRPMLGARRLGFSHESPNRGARRGKALDSRPQILDLGPQTPDSGRETVVAWLVVGGGARLAIRHVPFRIGRLEGNDLVLAGNRVSRRHAVIDLDGDSFVLIDCRSHNGTQLNGQPIRRALLRDGDHIGLSGYELVFETGEQ